MEMTVGSDGATKEIKGLVYYDTLTELEKAGHTCVAVLYQIRNCCVRTGRSVEIGHMMEVTKDVSKIGRSYALTLTDRGQQAFVISHQVFFTWDDTRLANLNDTEKDQLLALLQKAAEGMPEHV